MKDIIVTILKEETGNLDGKILRFLRRNYKSRVNSFGDDEKPLDIQTVSFNIDNEWYTISSFMSKKDMVNKIYQMLGENGIIDNENENLNTYNPERQRVIKTIKYFLDTVIFKKS